MPTGNVTMFFVRKGFGFIKPDEGEEEIFVHHSAIQAEGFTTLADGEAVEYELETNPENGKTRAVNVRGPGGAAVQGVPKGKGRGKGKKGGGDGEGDGSPKEGKEGKGKVRARAKARARARARAATAKTRNHCQSYRTSGTSYQARKLLLLCQLSMCPQPCRLFGGEVYATIRHLRVCSRILVKNFSVIKATHRMHGVAFLLTMCIEPRSRPHCMPSDRRTPRKNRMPT